MSIAKVTVRLLHTPLYTFPNPYYVYNKRMDVLLVDSSILVVNKPAGLATIPGGWEKDSASLKKILEEEFGPLWVVHRLDKTTSGLVVFARNAESHRDLNKQFEQRQTHKIYQAIVVGTPTWDNHTARHLLRINVGHGHRTIVDNTNGKSAETIFTVLDRFDGYALLAANPTTGRTHQVRVHAAALQYPLLGDSLYGAPETDLIVRPALHAQTLIFKHPTTGQHLTCSAPYPQDFENALKKLRK